MSFRFWFAWALFIVFQKTTSRMPWPIKHFLLSQFSDEFEAQRRVLNQRSVQDTDELDNPKSTDLKHSVGRSRGRPAGSRH